MRRGLTGKEGKAHGASLSSLFYLQLLAGSFEQGHPIQRFYCNGLTFWIEAVDRETVTRFSLLLCAVLGSLRT